MHLNLNPVATEADSNVDFGLKEELCKKKLAPAGNYIYANLQRLKSFALV